MKLTLEVNISDEANCKGCQFLYKDDLVEIGLPSNKLTCVLFHKNINFWNPKKCQECLDSQRLAMEQLKASGAISEGE